MIGNGVGPILGGVMAEKLSWRWCCAFSSPPLPVSPPRSEGYCTFRCCMTDPTPMHTVWINLPVAAVSIAVIALFLPLKKVKGSWKKCVFPLPLTLIRPLTTFSSTGNSRKSTTVEQLSPSLLPFLSSSRSTGAEPPSHGRLVRCSAASSAVSSASSSSFCMSGRSLRFPSFLVCFLSLPFSLRFFWRITIAD